MNECLFAREGSEAGMSGLYGGFSQQIAGVVDPLADATMVNIYGQSLI
jgi:hypothetical protein